MFIYYFISFLQLVTFLAYKITVLIIPGVLGNTVLAFLLLLEFVPNFLLLEFVLELLEQNNGPLVHFLDKDCKTNPKAKRLWVYRCVQG